MDSDGDSALTGKVGSRAWDASTVGGSPAKAESISSRRSQQVPIAGKVGSRGWAPGDSAFGGGFYVGGDTISNRGRASVNQGFASAAKAKGKDFDFAGASEFICSTWSESIVPTLSEYIRIPNQSPAYDKEWESNGHMDTAMAVLEDWLRTGPLCDLEGMTWMTHRAPGRTPLLLVKVAAFNVPAPQRSAWGRAAVPAPKVGKVLLYAHMDKQPPMDEGWDEGKGPYIPVIDDLGRLYGRGGADDGYGLFAALTALASIQRQGGTHGDAVIVIEASEESGSPDLPFWLETLKDDIGEGVDFVIGLDSGCLSWDRLWVTNALRGLVSGTLTVSTIAHGVHSGIGGGLAPSSFRIMRALLDRIEDSATGEIKVPALRRDIPDDVIAGLAALDTFPPGLLTDTLPLNPGVVVPGTNVEHALANTWQPVMEIVGADGLPPTATAGNVLRPVTSVRVSIRLPPGVDHMRAGVALKQVLERDPPAGATVTFAIGGAAPGWQAPTESEWLKEAHSTASETLWKSSPGYMGIGGTIPTMPMIEKIFPTAQVRPASLPCPISRQPTVGLRLRASSPSCCVPRSVGHA